MTSLLLVNSAPAYLMKSRLKGMASATALRLVPFSIRMALKVVAMAANAVCRREPYSCWLSGTALSVPLSFHPFSSDFHHCRTIVNAPQPPSWVSTYQNARNARTFSAGVDSAGREAALNVGGPAARCIAEPSRSEHRQHSRQSS